MSFKYISVIMLCCLGSLVVSAQKDYRTIYKNIVEASAVNFKGSLGEQFNKDSAGQFYRALNMVDADTAYFTKVSSLALSYYTNYVATNPYREIVQSQLTAFMNEYKENGLATVENISNGGIDYMLMKTKDKGKLIFATMYTPASKFLQVWSLSDWNTAAEATSEFCTTLKKLIESASQGTYQLKEFASSEDPNGPMEFAYKTADYSTAKSKIAIPGEVQSTIDMLSTYTKFHSVYKVFSFQYQVGPEYNALIQKVEDCINALQLKTSKYRNGPQNTYYEVGNATVAVRWHGARDNKFALYIEISYMPATANTYR